MPLIFNIILKFLAKNADIIHVLTFKLEDVVKSFIIVLHCVLRIFSKKKKFLDKDYLQG